MVSQSLKEFYYWLSMFCETLYNHNNQITNKLRYINSYLIYLKFWEMSSVFLRFHIVIPPRKLCIAPFFQIGIFRFPPPGQTNAEHRTGRYYGYRLYQPFVFKFTPWTHVFSRVAIIGVFKCKGLVADPKTHTVRREIWIINRKVSYPCIGPQ